VNAEGTASRAAALERRAWGSETMQRDGRGLVTVMVMSSYKNRQWKFDILVQPDAANHLHTTTLIKVRHIMSFDATRMIKKIGTVDGTTLGRVKEYLSKHFGI